MRSIVRGAGRGVAAFAAAAAGPDGCTACPCARLPPVAINAAMGRANLLSLIKVTDRIIGSFGVSVCAVFAHSFACCALRSRLLVVVKTPGLSGHRVQ